MINSILEVINTKKIFYYLYNYGKYKFDLKNYLDIDIFRIFANIILK